LDVANGRIPAGTTYSWPDPVVTGGITGGVSGSDEASIFGTLTNNTGFPQTATYTVTPLSGSCLGLPFTVTITVNPLPSTSLITGEALICETAINKVYSVTDHAGSKYTWTVPGILTKTFDGNLYFILVDANSPGSGDIEVYETILSTGCSGPVVPFTVNVASTIPGNPVTGPADVCKDASGTYLVLPDNPGSTYSWSLPPGAYITGDPTLHEVDVTFPLVVSGNVSVYETNGACSAFHPATPVTVHPLPTPGLAGPATACVNSTGNTYSTEAGMSAYAWTVSAGGTITSGSGTNSITVDWNTVGNQAVSVNYNDANGCPAAVPAGKMVNVYPLPVPVISGPGTVCLSSTGNIYTTETGMSNYTWSISAGGTVTAGGGLNDNYVTVTWNSTGVQTVSVSYTNVNGCTSALPTDKTVMVNPLPAPTISGPSPPICRNSVGNTYVTEAGMTGYIWNVSAGGIITAGGTGTNSVTITWTNVGPNWVSVNYTNADGCTAAASTVFPVTVEPLPAPTLTGNLSACLYSTGNVYTTEPGMTGYTWNIPGTATITAGGTATDNSVTVTWNALGLQTMSVNYTNPNGCMAPIPTTINITVNLLPTPTISGPVAVCETSSGNIYTTEPGMSNYTWLVSANGTITAGGTATDDNVTVTWNTAGAGTVSVNYNNANGCTAAAPVSKAVTVNPLPVPTISGPAVVCRNSTGNTYVTEIGMANYVWSVSAGGTITAGGGTTHNVVIVTWNTTGPQTVSVIYTNASGCTAPSATIYNVTVNELASPSITGPSSVCVAVPGNTYNTQAGMTNYIWSVSSGGTVTAGGTATDNSVTVTWNSSGAKMVSVNYTNSNGCNAPAPVVYNVTVNPLPVALLSGDATICPSETSVIKSTMLGGLAPFELDIENHGVVSGYTSDADIIVAPVATTTYKLLRVTDANGCQSLSPSSNLMGDATVTLGLLPSITLQPADQELCEYEMTSFNVTASGDGITYQWYVNDGGGYDPVTDGGIYFGSSGNVLNIFGALRDMDGYRYQVVVSGCSVDVPSSEAMLTVHTVPEIVSQPRDTSICSLSGATFSVSATGTALLYQWQVNKGSGFTDVFDDSNFSGANLETLTLTNVPVSFNNYIFRVIVDGSCGVPVYSNFVVLRVNKPPTVTLNPVSKSVCDGGGPVYFLANGSGMIDSLRWQVFSGGAWTDIHDNMIYSGSTTQQMSMIGVPLSYNGNQYRLALKASCDTTYTNPATLTVNSLPVVNFTSDTINACGGVGQVINPSPSGGSGTWTQHLWTGDVGPLNNYFIQAPTFKSLLAGTYILAYLVKDSNGCSGTDTVAVAVESPDATFVSDQTTICNPDTIHFTKDMTGISSFVWDFGDGTTNNTDPNPEHIFSNSNPSSNEYFNVSLTVLSARSCPDTYSQLITVHPAIDATFTPGNDTVCSGSSLTFTSLPGAGSYYWDYGDGTGGPGAYTTAHQFTNLSGSPLPVTVSLSTTSFYGCQDMKTVNIIVMPVPTPDFAPDPQSQIFIATGNTVNFINSTMNMGSFTYNWDFGDGTTAINLTNPSHVYSGIGTYNVKMTATNGSCSASITHDIVITPTPPVASFANVPDGCTPLSVEFNNTSLNTEVPGTTYRWDFGDGGYSIAKNPSYTFLTAGRYKVELTVYGPYGATSSYSQVIEAQISPRAYFEITPVLVFVNDERVRCFNLSEDANSYMWDFGDGETSTEKEPYHKYMEEGVYDITLWAYDTTTTCSDRYVLSPGVTVEPAGEVRFSTVFTPNKEGPIDRTDLPTGGTEIDQFFFPPIREKVINYKLQIFNRHGVLIFESRNINIPWNGYYKGQLCPQGVYVWYVEGKYANGQPFKKVGDITLLH
jgi:PKD repeat protein